MYGAMLVWGSVPEGYWECVIDEYRGIVGLSLDRAGWHACVTGPRLRQTSERLFSRAHEAKAWVEQQLAALAPDAQTTRWTCTP